MNQIVLVFILIGVIIGFSGCSEPEVVYVQKCPKLQTYEVKKIDSITYEVIDEYAK